jgi:hypothetical protein
MCWYRLPEEAGDVGARDAGAGQRPDLACDGGVRRRDPRQAIGFFGHSCFRS